MSRARVFVASSYAALDELLGVRAANRDDVAVLAAGGPAHAVTEALRGEYPDADDEELEYLALTAAAQASVPRVGEGGPFRRMVLALDADGAQPAGSEDPTAVTVGARLLLSDVAAVHVDSDDAAPDVFAARRAHVAGGEDAEELLVRCLDHELGWYAATELAEVLAGARGCWTPSPDADQPGPADLAGHAGS
ncbi:DUF6912 family protein [Nocardioides mesophilus]|uniref:Uncharacterized protein n=1 Tax=Nocardioides mesophilus TaxID=433659 RepID=A0A7G9RDC5_9ACTN|nr:hypothetical protein [Nocardioides mesophilus]QNN53600.1 hypothetical protein H9L09_04015 [Nocardioides mesophilus]